MKQYTGMRKGISLVEMIIAVILFATLAGISVKYYKNFFNTELTAKKARVAALLDQAAQMSNAYDAYLGEYYPCEPSVYVDGYYMGTAPASLQVAEGREHIVVVDWEIYSPYWCDTVAVVGFLGDYSYSNGATAYFTPYYSSTISALYLPTWWMRSGNGTDPELEFALANFRLLT